MGGTVKEHFFSQTLVALASQAIAKLSPSCQQPVPMKKEYPRESLAPMPKEARPSANGYFDGGWGGNEHNNIVANWQEWNFNWALPVSPWHRRSEVAATLKNAYCVYLFLFSGKEWNGKIEICSYQWSFPNSTFEYILKTFQMFFWCEDWRGNLINSLTLISQQRALPEGRLLR